MRQLVHLVGIEAELTQTFLALGAHALHDLFGISAFFLLACSNLCAEQQFQQTRNGSFVHALTSPVGASLRWSSK